MKRYYVVYLPRADQLRILTIDQIEYRVKHSPHIDNALLVVCEL